MDMTIISVNYEAAIRGVTDLAMKLNDETKKIVDRLKQSIENRITLTGKVPDSLSNNIALS